MLVTQLTATVLLAWAPAAAVVIFLVIDRYAGQQSMKRLFDQVDNIHLWLSKEDDDGVKLYYQRRSLEEVISKLAEAVTRQTEVLAEMKNQMVIDRKVREATKKVKGDS